LAAVIAGARPSRPNGKSQVWQESAREREVVTLVAQGMAKMAIAGALSMSVRTVEGHIYCACTKLGVTNRAGLTALISDHHRPQRSDTRCRRERAGYPPRSIAKGHHRGVVYHCPEHCEAALRRLPDAYPLALRRAGVADEVIGSYLHIEP
jgi:DNA-binding CsgD family transcriptional regulator